MRRKIAIASVAVALFIAGVVYWHRDSRQGIAGLEVVSVPVEQIGEGDLYIAHFSDAQTMFQFDYRAAPNGYVLLARNDTEDASDAPVKAFTLFLKADYEGLLRDEGLPREGPPGIDIQVFNPGPNITPNEWAAQHPARSNLQPGTEITWETIDGIGAARYSWDGLYQGQTVILARKGWVYMFTLSYADEEMLADFNELLTTLHLQR